VEKLTGSVVDTGVNILLPVGLIANEVLLRRRGSKRSKDHVEMKNCRWATLIANNMRKIFSFISFFLN
jgi:hypothetical protein